MFKFITSRPFWVNLIVALAIICAVFALFFMSLSAITKHDAIKKVPDVVGKNVDDAIRILNDAGLDVSIQDSVYIDSIPKASVIRESPDADAEVKADRTIYLTVNRSAAPMVEMPDLRGFSITSAQLLLQNLGLKLGGTRYVADIAKNAVKQQLYNNGDIAPGTKIPMGSMIVLVLGNGAGSATLDVPDVTGMTLSEARDYLQTFSLSIGSVNAGADVTDQENAYISRQSPTRFDGAAKNRIRPGQAINVWLTSQAPAGAQEQNGNAPAPAEPQQKTNE